MNQKRLVYEAITDSKTTRQSFLDLNKNAIRRQSLHITDMRSLAVLSGVAEQTKKKDSKIQTAEVNKLSLKQAMKKSVEELFNESKQQSQKKEEAKKSAKYLQQVTRHIQVKSEAQSYVRTLKEGNKTIGKKKLKQ